MAHLALVRMTVAMAIRRLPEAKPLGRAMDSAQENRHSAVMEQLSVQARLLAASASWLAVDQVNLEALAMPQVQAMHLEPHQELRLRRVAHFPLLLAPVRRHSQDQDPSASFRERLAARKCNRAARCGGYPIFARCHLRRNRRGFAGCDNKCSRSQRKYGRPAEPSLIAAADKHRCRPLPFAD